MRKCLAILILPVAVLSVVGCGSSKGSSSSPSASNSTPASSSAAPASTTPRSSSSTGAAASSGAAVRLAVKTFPGLGPVLVTSQGRTLYTFAPDKHKKVTCVGSCATVWPPLKGSKASGAGLKASLLGSDRDPAGGSVITYAGWPLYTYIADTVPGAHNGQGLNLTGGLWYVISPTGKVITKK